MGATGFADHPPEAQVNTTGRLSLFILSICGIVNTRLESQTFGAGNHKPLLSILNLVGGDESLLASPFHYEREGEFFAWRELQRSRENPVVLIIFIHGSGCRLVCRRQAEGTGVFCARCLCTHVHARSGLRRPVSEAS